MNAIINLQWQSAFLRDLLRPWRVYVRNRGGVYCLRDRAETLDEALTLSRPYGTREVHAELPQ